MFKPTLLFRSLLIAFVGVGVSASVSAACHTKKCLDAMAWTSGYTAIITSNSSPKEAVETAEFIRSMGGTPAIITPHVILGWVEPRLWSTLRGQHGIRLISRGRLFPASLGLSRANHDEATSTMAAEFFNSVISGELATQVDRGLLVETNPLVGDAGGAPEDDAARSGRFRVVPAGHHAPFANASMLGVIDVVVFLIDSNGAAVADPNHPGDADVYTWTNPDLATISNQALMGMSFWANQAQARSLYVGFLVSYWGPDWDPLPRQGYEPILHPRTDDYLWVNEIMRRYVPPYAGARPGGYGATLPLTWEKVHDQVEAFNNDQRLGCGLSCTGAFSVFVAYNPSPASSRFTDGANAFTYYGGPWADMLFRNGDYGPDNFNRVLTHETGHIFYACDEYWDGGAGSSCSSCTTCWVFGPRGATPLNRGCENPNTGCAFRTSLCMMKRNDYALCPDTPQQIGW